MNSKRNILMIAAAITAFVGVGCNTATNTNNGNIRNTNVNTTGMANNANTYTNVNTNANSSNSNRWNPNISREEYERNRSEYERGRSTSETVGQSLEDSWLWFKTKSALMTTSDLRDSTINVDVQDGVITLKGTVETAAEKTKAKQVADGIEGKKRVVDQLKVAPNDSMTNMNGNSNANRR